MTRFCVWFLLPAVIAVGLAAAFERGTMWKWAGMMSLALLVFAVFQPDVAYYNHGPMVAAGVSTVQWFLAPLAAGVVVLILSGLRIPSWITALPAALMAWLVLVSISWIS